MPLRTTIIVASECISISSPPIRVAHPMWCAKYITQYYVDGHRFEMLSKAMCAMRSRAPNTYCLCSHKLYSLYDFSRLFRTQRLVYTDNRYTVDCVCHKTVAAASSTAFPADRRTRRKNTSPFIIIFTYRTFIYTSTRTCAPLPSRALAIDYNIY